jgi:hypothetical protein
MLEESPFDDFKQFVDEMTNYDQGIIIGTTMEELNKKKYK